MNKALVKKAIIDALDELPDEKVEELFDFTEFILSKTRIKRLDLSLDPDKDPILRLIGLADEEPFADKIDDDLYGNLQ